MIWHPMMLFNEALSSADGVTMSRLKVPCVEFSCIEPGLRIKQPRSLITSRAKHLALLFRIKIFGTIGKAANCCANPLSTLTLSDGGFNG